MSGKDETNEALVQQLVEKEQAAMLMQMLKDIVMAASIQVHHGHRIRRMLYDPVEGIDSPQGNDWLVMEVPATSNSVAPQIIGRLKFGAALQAIKE